VIVGGLRARLIRDSVFHAVDDALRALGWYEPSSNRSQVSFRAYPYPLEEQVPPNTLALSDENDSGDEMELGSKLTEFTWAMYVDVYGEDDAIALHLAGDVADILAGRMPSVGRGRPAIDVYDYTLATPVVIFGVEVFDVRKDRAHGFPQPWLRFWRSVTFNLVDSYDDEDELAEGGLATEQGEGLLTESDEHLEWES